MEPNLNIVLFSNILLLIILIFWKKGSNIRAHIIALSIGILNVVYVYVLLRINKINADFSLFGIDMPYPFVLIIMVSLLGLYYSRDVSNKIIYLIIFGLVCNIFLLRPYNAIPYLFDPQSEVLGKAGALLLVINAYLFGGILPLAVLKEENRSIYDTYFSIKGYFQYSSLKSINIGVILYVIIYYIYSLYLGGIISVNRLEPFSTWAIYILWQFIFGSLLNLIVLILFPHYILRKLFGLKNNLLLIIILGIIFGAAHFTASLPIMAWFSIFGMIFAYMYIRTKSLTYGLILYSITDILFIH